MLALCHQRRNRGEYEGFLEVDDQLVKDLIEAAGVLEVAVDGGADPVKRRM